MYREEIAAYVPQNQQEVGDKEMMLEYLRRFPDNILTRQNKIAHFTASGFVVNSDATRVLMAHHNLYKVWAWTGGHADGEGDLLSVALREAREETGVVHIRPLSTAMASLEILPVWGHVKRGEWVPSHQHLRGVHQAAGTGPAAGGQRAVKGLPHRAAGALRGRQLPPGNGIMPVPPAQVPTCPKTVHIF